MRPERLPWVSVCLLTYKRAHALPATLDSLLAQSHGDFELIINDDRSPDDTEEICREYERRDPRVRYFKNAVNLRYAGNQNAALLRANSDYVAIVHDGDIYRLDLIEKWTRALVTYPTAALVFNSIEVVNERRGSVEVQKHPYAPLVPGIELFDKIIRSPSSPIYGIVMVRKARVLSVGPFDPRIPTLADVDMWLRLLLRYDAAYIAEPLLRIAPREPGHHNTAANWSVRGEQELIFALNSARRYKGQAREITRLRRRIAPMVWKVRVISLLHCLRRRNFRGAWKGLKFIVRKLDFAANASPDSVTDWESALRAVNR